MNEIRRRLDQNERFFSAVVPIVLRQQELKNWEGNLRKPMQEVLGF
jgi:hypothetical protein